MYHSAVQCWGLYSCRSSGFGYKFSSTSHLITSLVMHLGKNLKECPIHPWQSSGEMSAHLHSWHPVRTSGHGDGGHKLSISMQRKTSLWSLGRESREEGLVQTSSDGGKSVCDCSRVVECHIIPHNNKGRWVSWCSPSLCCWHLKISCFFLLWEVSFGSNSKTQMFYTFHYTSKHGYPWQLYMNQWHRQWQSVSENQVLSWLLCFVLEWNSHAADWGWIIFVRHVLLTLQFPTFAYFMDFRD